MLLSEAEEDDEKWKYNHFYAFLTMEGVEIYLMICLAVNGFLYKEVKIVLHRCSKEETNQQPSLGRNL
jgi:hypothetical protein